MVWVWVIGIVTVAGVLAVVLVDRVEPMADVYDDRPAVTIPTGRPLTADDLRAVRFSTAVRGYRMDEVDALMSRLQADLLNREASVDRATPPTDAVVAEPAGDRVTPSTDAVVAEPAGDWAAPDSGATKHEGTEEAGADTSPLGREG